MTAPQDRPRLLSLSRRCDAPRDGPRRDRALGRCCRGGTRLASHFVVPGWPSSRTAEGDVCLTSSNGGTAHVLVLAKTLGVGVPARRPGICHGRLLSPEEAGGLMKSCLRFARTVPSNAAPCSTTPPGWRRDHPGQPQGITQKVEEPVNRELHPDQRRGLVPRRP